jgi:alpha-amylase/alpha-mannosidase (GH57 family)
MYTSCAWFFDDVSRIETLQILRYAARAIQLAQSVAGVELETGFLNRLTWARSNIAEYGDGKRLFETSVRPSMLSLESVAAHYSVRSLFEEYGERDRVHCYTVERKRLTHQDAGRSQLALGQVEVTSLITGESRCLTYAVLHFGDHTLTGGVRTVEEDEAYEAMVAEVSAAFNRAELTVVVRLIDQHFKENTYSLGSLFRDEQHRILGQILESTRVGAEAVYEQLYVQNAALMRFLSHRGLPTPRAIHMAGELVLNTKLRAQFEQERLDLEEVHELLDEAREAAIQLDKEGLGYTLQHTLERLAEHATGQLEDAGEIQSLIDALSMARALPFEVDLTGVQNLFFGTARQAHAELIEKAAAGDERAGTHAARLEALAATLEIRIRTGSSA